MLPQQTQWMGAEGANANVGDSRASIWWVMLTRYLKYEYLKYLHNTGCSG